MTGPPQPIGSNLPLASSLPRVSFRRIPQHEAQALALPAGVHDHQHVGFGFNNGEPFEPSDHYRRHLEPVEADLKRQVEYDMDEQDKEWLDAVNLERRRDQLDAITYESFEIIIDRLEKEWFDLMKRVPPKPQQAAIGPDGEPLTGAEDTECAICDDGECENSNAIVFCDGCNLAVHQDCYGIPYIPEGQWLCRKCTVSPDRAVSCVLCPNEGGAFKQTTHGKWAHLLCAMWIPEAGVSNSVYMEPIDSIERIPKARWKLQCYLCRHRHGACIQCDNKACFTAFHVTCARKAGLLIKAQRQRAPAHHHHEDDYSGADENDEVVAETLKAMCHKHLPKHLRHQQRAFPSLLTNGAAGDGSFEDENASSTRASTPVLPTLKPTSHRITIRRGANGAISAVAAPPGTTKSARAYKKSYRAGPPLVPAFVVSRVLDYIGKIQLRKKQAFVTLVAKFWSLKREARRGAPLLKRLHLEPWTAISVPREMTEAERSKKLQFTLLLREDLERLRMLAELVRKREREKLRQMDLIRENLVENIMFPFHANLKQALEKISTLDRNNLFLSPVSRSEVPDYYDIVKQPMDWATISSRIASHTYERIDDFIRDVELVFSNAILYNKPDTAFHRNALRIQRASTPILAKLRELRIQHHVEVQDMGGAESTAEANAEDLQMEPPLDILHVLDQYDDEKVLQTIREDEDVAMAPSNIVEDLVRQYHRTARPAKNERQLQIEAKKERRRRSYIAAAETRRNAREAKRTVPHPDDGSGAEEVQKTTSATKPVRRSQRAPLNHVSSTGVRRDQNGHRYQSSGLDLEVAPGDLEAKDTFLRFENGWILPEGSRRHGRDRQDMSKAETNLTRALPRKMVFQICKSKGSETSHTVTGRSGKRLQKEIDSSSGVKRLSGRSEAVPEVLDASCHTVDHSVAQTTNKNLARDGGGKRLRNASKADTDMSVDAKRRRIDDIETIQGADNSQLWPRRSRRRSLHTQNESVQSSPLTSDDEHASAAEDGQRSNATASELARVHAEKARRATRQSTPSSRVNKVSRRTTAKAKEATGSGTSSEFEVGTIVWAKLAGHPFFPAEIMPEDDEIVPLAVLDAKEDHVSPTGRGEDLHLLRFYDPLRSYGWVPTRSLRLLFEDEVLDEKMISAARTGSQRNGVRKAVKMAQAAVQGTLED